MPDLQYQAGDCMAHVQVTVLVMITNVLKYFEKLK